MKNLVLIFITLLVVGCCAGCATAPAPAPIAVSEPIVNEYGDTAKQAEVRAWITKEVIRNNEKRAVVNDMLSTGQIGYEEYFLLMDECAVQRESIVPRAKALFN